MEVLLQRVTKAASRHGSPLARKGDQSRIFSDYRRFRNYDPPTVRGFKNCNPRFRNLKSQIQKIRLQDSETTSPHGLGWASDWFWIGFEWVEGRASGWSMVGLGGWFRVGLGSV